MTMLASPVIELNDVRNTPLAAQALSFSAENTIKLPRVGIITRIEGQITVSYDITTVTEAEDSVARLLSNLSIRDGAGNTYWAAADGRELQYMSNFLARNPSFWASNPLGASGGAGQTARVNFTIDFQDTPVPGGQSVIDTIAGIITRVPQQRLNELDLVFTVGTAADLAASGTYDNVSISMRITPIIILAETQSWFRVLAKGLAKPAYRSNSDTFTGAVSAFGQQRTLPVGFIISKSLIIAIDDASPAVRSDATITALNYEDNLKAQVRFSRDNIQDFAAQLQSEYFAATAIPTGVYLLNWPGIVGGVGLNRRHRAENDDLLNFTIGAAGSAKYSHKGFTTYPPGTFEPFRT